MRLVRPFLAVLARDPKVPRGLLQDDPPAPDDLRVPVAASQEFLRQIVELTGARDLGLRAASETRLGTFEVLEFAAFSAPTWREAVETTFRYIGLMNEAAEFRVEVRDGRAHLWLGSRVPLTRAGIDFQSALLYLTARRWLDQEPADLEVWLTYPEPGDLSAHRAVFGDAVLRFDAPENAFVHDEALFDVEVPGADPKLHAVLREHADRMLREHAAGEGLVEQVRAQLLESLQGGPLTADDVAARMGVTRRTLTRRLSQHGTSFKALLDEVRRQAATHYLERTDHSLVDIAFLLGFSESSAFVRAFKRWHGVAPTTYRRDRRGG
jgi:AraC-like DNA-binding protein